MNLFERNKINSTCNSLNGIGSANSYVSCSFSRRYRVSSTNLTQSIKILFLEVPYHNQFVRSPKGLGTTSISFASQFIIFWFIFSKNIDSALRQIFSIYDIGDTGYVTPKEFQAVLHRLGRNHDEVERVIKESMLESNRTVDQRISFQEFTNLIDLVIKEQPNNGDYPKKSFEILEDYQQKSVSNKNYVEAEKTKTRLETLTNQEISRQEKIELAQHELKKNKLACAHERQFYIFSKSMYKSQQRQA